MKQKSQNILQLRTLYHNCRFIHVSSQDLYIKNILGFKIMTETLMLKYFFISKHLFSYMYLSKADYQHLN